MRQIRRRVNARSFFADAAGHWPAMRSELYGDLYLLEALIGLLPSSWIVADLGCGTGEMAVKLAREVNQVIGVDQSHEMLQRAHDAAAGISNLRLVQGDLCVLPLDDHSCDAALMLLVLSYQSDPQKALAEMARIVRPGGKVVVVDLMRHDRDDFRRQMGQENLGFTEEELIEMLRQAGAGEAACRVVAPEPEAKGPALLIATAQIPQREGSGTE